MSTLNFSFAEYLFDHIYILSSPHRDRSYKKNIVAMLLEVDPCRISYVDGSNCERLVRNHFPDPELQQHEMACCLELFEDAVARGHKSILLFRNSVFLHKRFSDILVRLLQPEQGRRWRGIGLGELAYALTNRTFTDILTALYALTSDPDEVIRQVCDKDLLCPERELVIPPEQITEENHQDYLYHYHPGNQRISFCCVTRRPHLLKNILGNYGRQSYPDKELIIALNTSSCNRHEIRQAVDRYGIDNSHLFFFDDQVTLGECLNATIDASQGHFWCKIDDDDFYGDEYLMEAHEYLVVFPGDVVGKGKVHVFFPLEHQGYITTDAEYRYTGFPRHHGATTFTTLSLARQLSFVHRNICEDEEFYRELHARNYTLTNSPPGNYVYMRHADNTSDFERELSREWRLKECPLYTRMIQSYPGVIDYSRADVEQFAFLFNYRLARKNRRKSIPGIIHQIWLGPEPRPTQWTDSWEIDYCLRHPQWEYRLWNEANISEFKVINSEAYCKSSEAGKADLLRYEILYRYGGVYIDADSLYINSGSLDRYMSDVDDSGIVLAREPFQPQDQPEPLLAVGVIGSVPGNELLRFFLIAACRAIEAAMAEGRSLQAWELSGPSLVTTVMKNIRCRTILPSYCFYPEYWVRREEQHFDRKKIEKQYPASMMYQFGYSTALAAREI